MMLSRYHDHDEVQGSLMSGPVVKTNVRVQKKTCALACVYYVCACTTRLRVFAHYWLEFLQHWRRHSLGHINLHGTLDLYICSCVCVHYDRACMHIRPSAHVAFAHFWTDSLRNCWRHFLGHRHLLRRTIDVYICLCVCVRARASVLCARACACTCAYVCVRTFWTKE
jgi:hypothetical protein